jgi:hypothetical protein
MAAANARLQSLATLKINRRQNDTFGNWRDVDNVEAYILEGWGEGFMLGALFIMAVITVANMRRRVLLHKMILLEASFCTQRAAADADDIVVICHEPWDILLYGLFWIWFLSFIYRCATLLLILHT